MESRPAAFSNHGAASRAVTFSASRHLIAYIDNFALWLRQFIPMETLEDGETPSAHRERAFEN